MWFNWMKYWHKDAARDYLGNRITKTTKRIKFVQASQTLLSYLLLGLMIWFIIFAAF